MHSTARVNGADRDAAKSFAAWIGFAATKATMAKLDSPATMPASQAGLTRR